MKTRHAALTILTALMMPIDAFAYLDPGTGSMILQGLIGGIAAGIFVLQTYWRRLRGLFKKEPKPDPAAPAAPEDMTK